MPPRLSPLERFMLFAISFPLIDSAIIGTLSMNIHFPFDVQSCLAFWVITTIRFLSFCLCLSLALFLQGPGVVQKLDQIEDNTEEILEAVDEDAESTFRSGDGTAQR